MADKISSFTFRRQHISGKFGLWSLVASVTCLVTLVSSAKAITVVSATPELAAIARQLGGPNVTVESLTKANQDPHNFEVLPKHVAAVRHADLYLRVGAGLDYWSDELLSAAGRESLVVVDCSRGILLIDEPVNADHGHVSKLHSAGNPHYWLAPSSIPRIAQGVCGGLQRADPQHYGEFAQSLSQFLKSYQVHFSSWTSAMLNCHGARIVTYHRLWDYFARDFGMEVVGTIEPHPGAEPSPESLALLEETIHEQRARLIIYEPFESQRWAKLLARDTGISIVRAPLSAQSTENAEGILGFFDQLTTVIGASCAPQHP